MNPSSIRLVAFDLMDTVVRDPYREALEAGSGMRLEELLRRRGGVSDAWPAFERGELTEDAYWRLHAEAGVTIDRDAFHTARRAGYRFLPGMAELLGQLEGQVRRVVATNYPDWIAELTTGLLAGRVDAVHASCHLGVRKPDAAFYRRLLAETGMAPHEVLFVDDREVNVEGARAVGIAAHRFTDVPRLVTWLREAGLDVGSPA